MEPSGSQNEAPPEGEDQPTSLIVTNLPQTLFGNQQMKVPLIKTISNEFIYLVTELHRLSWRDYSGLSTRRRPSTTWRVSGGLGWISPPTRQPAKPGLTCTTPHSAAVETWWTASTVNYPSAGRTETRAIGSIYRSLRLSGSSSSHHRQALQ